MNRNLLLIFMMLSSWAGTDSRALMPGSAPQGAPQTNFGFLHTPLGTATLGQDGNDLLIVNNGDGSDFLEIGTGPVEGFKLEMQPFPPSAPAAAERVLRWSLEDGTEQSLHEERQNFGVIFRLNQGTATTQPRRIELLFDGEIVAVQPGHVGAWDLIILGDPVAYTAGPDIIVANGSGGGPGNAGQIAIYSFSWGASNPGAAPSTALLPDGRTASINGFRIVPESGQPHGLVESIVIAGTDTETLRISGEMMKFDGVFMSARGDVELAPQGDEVQVMRDLQSLQASGVRVYAPNAKRLDVELALPAPPSQVPSMAGMSIEARDNSGSTLMDLDWKSVGGLVELSLLLDPAIVGTTTVESHLGSQLVATSTLSMGFSATCADWPSSFGFEQHGNVLICAMSWNQALAIDFGNAGGGVVFADAIEIRIESMSVLPDFDRVAVLANRLSGFVIEQIDLTTAAATSPHPGTSEDFKLLTTDHAFGAPTAASLKSVPALAPTNLVLSSHFGSFDFMPLLVLVQLLAPAEMSVSPFPAIAVNPSGIIGILVGATSSPTGPVLLAPGGSVFTISPPAALVGHRLLLQGLIHTPVAANGIFASSDGHELLILP